MNDFTVIEQPTTENLIKALAKNIPPYNYNCNEFIPGKSTVYYSGPYWDHEEMEAALTALVTGKWLATGNEVLKFQREFSQKFGVGYSHMVNSGSSANLVMVAALKKYFDWGGESEIIVSPVGFPTTIAPIVQNGMNPIFADIELDTLNFDLDRVEEEITEYTVAIFVSPVLGNPPDMDRLQRIAEDNGIVLIGDNCDSLGSLWNGKSITDFYVAWSTSFYPAHHMTTGEGGMVSSMTKEIVDIARSFAWWGRDCRCVGKQNLLPNGCCGNRFDCHLGEEHGIVDHKYVFSNMGYNLKPLDFQGAIGQSQLRKVDTIDRLRRENFRKFSELLVKYIPGIRIADKHTLADPSWFGVPVICESPELKTKLVEFLEKNKIQTRNYFAGNILAHPGYRDLGNWKDYPVANLALSNVFFVGCPPHYDSKVFKYIDEVMQSWK